MDFLLKHVWFILFLVWGFPLSFYRSKFRKIVYQTDNWIINIKPVFWKELKALFGNIYPDNKSYIRFRNFYRFYLAIYSVLFLLYFLLSDNNSNSDSMQKIEVGSKIPQFNLSDQHGNNFDINSVLGKKNLVIYFYPKDDTPGCTAEACYFQDQFEVFKQANADVIGISGQSVESHKNFAEKYRLTYTLLSDDGNTIRKLFGVPSNFLGLLPGRVTYIVDKTGTVIYMFNSQSQATKHVDEALKILQQLESK